MDRVADQSLVLSDRPLLDDPRVSALFHLLTDEMAELAGLASTPDTIAQFRRRRLALLDEIALLTTGHKAV